MVKNLDKSEVKEIVSAALYQTRWRLDIPQSEVAAQVGITQQQLSTYEQGKCCPDLTTLVALADFYDVSLDYLAGRTSSKEAHKKSK